MSRALAAARACAYVAIAAGAATSPDVARTIALLAPTHPAPASPALADATSATLGWLATAGAGALVRTVGFGGLAFVTAFAVCCTLALVEWRGRRAGSPTFAFGAAFLSAACLLDSLHVGQGATNGLFLAALLATFDLRGSRGLAGTAIVTVLWCNASAQGILAPLFAIAFALGATIDRAERPERMHVQSLAVVAALCTLATPAFLAYPTDAWRALSLDNALNDLLPSAPAVVAPLSYHAGVILTIVVALAIGARASRTGDTLVFALAAILAFSKGALVPFVGIAGAPVLAEAATRIFGAMRAARTQARPPFTAFAATALVVALAIGVVGGARFTGFSAATQTAPYGALSRYARGVPGHGRMLCTKLQWCDVAERTYGFDVVADSRVPSAPDATIAAQRTISSAKVGWAAKVRALGVDAIFLDKRSGFATLLLADGWRSYATDGTGTIFVRTGRPL